MLQTFQELKINEKMQERIKCKIMLEYARKCNKMLENARKKLKNTMQSK